MEVGGKVLPGLDLSLDLGGGGGGGGQTFSDPRFSHFVKKKKKKNL